MNERNIYIVLANGAERTWMRNEYDDYEVNDGLFVVIKGSAWVGIYPIGQIRSIDVREG